MRWREKRSTAQVGTSPVTLTFSCTLHKSGFISNHSKGKVIFTEGYKKYCCQCSTKPCCFWKSNTPYHTEKWPFPLMKCVGGCTKLQADVGRVAKKCTQEKVVLHENMFTQIKEICSFPENYSRVKKYLLKRLLKYWLMCICSEIKA